MLGFSRKYIDSFEFTDETWFSSWLVPVVVALGYPAMVVSLKAFVARRGRPFDLKRVEAIHNFSRAAASLVLWLLLASEIVHLWSTSSLFDVYCDDKIQFNRGRHQFYYYVNYMFKFYELLDTVLLCLRGKPTPFLHTYHHAITAILAWVQMRAQMCVQWVVILMNLGVHVVMYTYYGLHALGIHVSWKQSLTTLQVTQFLIALPIFSVGLAWRLLHYFGYNSPPCHGTWFASWFGLAVWFSYIVLFIKLYKEKYVLPPKATAKNH
jgi:hypothetical protein